MFLDLIRRRNPRLIEAAIALHQRGELPANTYVIDLDAVKDNARAISTKADSLGLTVMAMTKQMGRNESFCRAVMRGGIVRSVAVDLECALATKRAGMELGHIGHLVQIPKWEADSAARLSPTWWTVFNAEKATEAAAASERLGREQPLLARIRGENDQFYRGHEGGFSASEIVAVAAALDKIPGGRFAGITTFPALLFDAASRTVKTTPNLETSAAGVRDVGALRTQGHRNQCSRHNLERDLGRAGRSRRYPGRARTRADRNDPAACERRPAGGAGGCLSDRGFAPLGRRSFLLWRRSLH